MNEQTMRLRRELEDNVRRGKELAARVDDESLSRRPAERSWSVAECLEHLNVSAEEYIGRIRAGLDAAERRPPRRRERLSILGRIFVWFMEPPVRKRLPAPRGFRPAKAPIAREVLLHRYDTLHAELIRLLEESDAFDRSRIKVPSPASDRMRLSVLDAFAILASHGRRHLWQAERAIR
ncbi:MAG TPA: DinB family protein [Thermoanaerobaculia bacterium]|nr:DinB family protein [Thermoanaerobaculia bacterium]